VTLHFYLKRYTLYSVRVAVSKCSWASTWAVEDPLDAFDRGIEWVSGELLCVASREIRSVSNLEHDDNRTPKITQTGDRS